MEKDTRRRILEELASHGQATVGELASAIKVRPTTIHHHLAKLEREELIHTEEERHGRGRPRVVARLTEQGRDVLPQGYRWLADELIDTISALEGSARVKLVFKKTADRLANRHLPVIRDQDLKGRVDEIARILAGLGFGSTAMRTAAGFCISQNHCPVLPLAERHPDVCAMEARMISRLAETKAERIAYRLDGEVVCTYLLRPRK